MLRVLIADDEERICQLIQVLGQWERLGLQVAGVASNGPDALELVRSLHPDILITDIRMPGCDGLAVIREARRCAPWLEVIIISGYAQFDYAQTALHYGVGEYLLKPINRDALNHTLEKMAGRCLARQQKETDMECLRLSQDDDRRLLRAKLIADLTVGRYAAQTSEELERVYHFTALNDAYQVFLLKIDYDTEQFGEASVNIVRNKARDVLAPILEAGCGDAVLDCAGASIIGVMNYPRETLDHLRAQLRDGLNQLVAQKSLFGPVDFSLALGPACFTPAVLSESFLGARAVIAERLTEGTGRMLEGSVGGSDVLKLGFQMRYDQAATHAIDVMSLEEADQAAEALKLAAGVQGARGWELIELARGAGLLFMTRLGADDSDRILSAYNERCGQCGTAEALFACLKDLQRRQMLNAIDRRKERDNQPIRSAKLYIRKHFSEPITLEEVSDAIGFSVNYFSTLFKKETGEGFAKYLTRIRMEEARAFLRDTRQPIAEICKGVGYGDIKHFTRTFKAETGLTPGEYRKLYG